MIRLKSDSINGLHKMNCNTMKIYCQLLVKSIISLGLFLSTFNAMASHIVGGQMSYRCLGSNRYEITLLVYRDCYNANPAASFDDPAPVGIYDAFTNTPVAITGPETINGKVLIPFTGEDTIRQTLINDCGVRNTDVCVHRTIYRDTVSLPYNPSGYIFAYQRCCRNVTVNNIIDPLETGSTYHATLTGPAQLACNSEANFKSWPYIYICTNSPLNFDHGAIDPDGDSLVYRLCVPSSGATIDFPNPPIPSNPPYDTVMWKAPFNLNNLMGGVPLQINPNTGRMTALPNTIGQYLVGVCVDEYRGGVFLSSTRRDFQFNVRECDLPPVAIASSKNTQCGNPTVEFENQSTGAVNFVKWIFDFPSLGNTSTLTNPTYTFATTGIHKVALIAYRTETCNDTSFIEVNIPNSGLKPDFSHTLYRCNDTYVINITDLSRDTIAGSTINSIQWQFNYNNDTILTTVQNPILNIPSSAGSVRVKMTITSDRNCIQVLYRDIVLESSQNIQAAFTYVVSKCNGVYKITPTSTSVNGIPNSTINSWAWVLTNGAEELTSTLQNPTFNITNPSNVRLQLTVTNSLGCAASTIQLPINTDVSDGLFPDFDRAPVVSCGTNCFIKLTSTSRDTINGNAGLSNSWQLWVGQVSLTSVEASPTFTIPCGSQVTVRLTITNAAGCSSSIIKTFTINPDQQVTADFSSNITNCVESSSIRLNGIFGAGFEPTRVNWTISNGQNATGTSFSTTLPAGTYNITMCATFTDNCKICVEKSITTKNINQISIPGATICLGESRILNQNVVAGYTYIWQSHPTLANSNTPTPTATPVTTTTYRVTVIDNVSGCSKVYTPEVIVRRNQDQLNFTFTQSCIDPLNVTFTNTGVATNVTWVIGTTPVTVSTAASPVVRFGTLGTFRVIMLGGTPCVDSISREIVLRPYEWPTLPDTVVACNTNMVNLNPGGSTLYTYRWNNAALLDNATIPNPKASLLQTTTFIVTITNTVENCSTTDRVVAILTRDNTVDVKNDSLVCKGSVVVITANNPLAGTYTWVNASGITIGTNSSISITVLSDTSVTVRVRDIYNCVHETTIRLRVQDARVQINGDLMICQGESTELTAVVADANNVQTYLWSPNTAIVSGQGTNKIIVNPTDNATYTVLVTYRNGCTTSASVSVSVSKFIAGLSISADPDTLIFSGTVNLLVTSGLGYTYNWDPASVLNNPSINNPIATIDKNTTFRVTVTNIDGCTSVLQTFVLVRNFECEEPFIFLPNAFSPNGDGDNDYLCLRSYAVNDYDLVVFDRWGNKVFETIRAVPSGGNVGCWDGRYKGNELSPDVYGYYLKARCVGGKQFYKQGNVTIIR